MYLFLAIPQFILIFAIHLAYLFLHVWSKDYVHALVGKLRDNTRRVDDDISFFCFVVALNR